MRKYKPTGCFKFLLFLIIFAPIAYLGASYARGEDGIQNLKNLFNIESSSSSSNSDVSNDTKLIKNLKEEIRAKDQEIDRLKQRIKELEDDGMMHK